MTTKRCWSALVLFGLLCASRGAGQSLADYDYTNLRFRGVGADLGFIWPNKVESTPAYSLRLDLGYLGPGVRIVPSVTYWSSTFKDGELARLADQLNRLPALQARNVVIDADEMGTIDWSNLSLAVDAQFVWTTPFRVTTYAGGGLGLHILNGRGSAVAGTFVEDLLDSTAAGAAAMAGLELQPFTHFRLYAEARYSLLSDIRYPGMRVGGSWMLAPRVTAAAGTQGGR